MKILDGIAPLAERYDGFILDLWGVVHDGRRPYPGVAEALGALKTRGKRVAFLSNAPRRAHVVDALLTGMGLDRALWDATVTSGEIAWRLLAGTHGYGRRALHIGPERDLSTVEGLDIDLVADPDAAEWVLNTGPDPERGNGAVEPYRPMLEACAARRLPMLCVNPDRFVMVGEQRVICAGALADLYVALGGPPAKEVGKPDPAVYAPVLDALGIAEPARIVAIGDSPHTDLAGAQGAGIDAVWALTGLAAHAHGAAPDPARLAQVAAAEGVRSIAALSGLRW
ncbi:TIGR01459 family HAD-type hydrolase [Falsiroseomonas oryzae]|uniref:TIGR01459 family HAD-type hydrolase n=1 Tax=Falsiroseomonas oryzae TaxID=2766473 RepID=UPI0022EAFA5A|nr:TIGR01459 family HAD-type hydrolase [Roseomonas sp. MO-31]